MEEQKVNDCYILSREIPLQQRAIHEIAKKSWNNLVIRDTDCIFILRDREKLIAHREKVLNNLPQILRDLPKQLKIKLINAMFNLQHGYKEVVSWEERCKSALPFTIFDPTIASEYQIVNCIDALGHFKELEWAKLFVDDEKQSLQKRFELACFYCFEDKIEYLWRIMKTNRQLPCEGNLQDIKSKYKSDDLIVIWVHQVENKFDELLKESSYYDQGFYCSGLLEAIAKGHEYAARYFWKRCSDDVKTNFFDSPVFDLLTMAAEDYHTGVVNFIYSLLNEEQKKKLIDYTIEDGKHRWLTSSAPIFCRLLESQYYESILTDILKSPFPIPTEIYKWILISLSFEMLESKILRHQTIFKDLWDNLSQESRTEVLEGNSYIIINLVKIKAMDLLKIIIQPLSNLEKDMILLNDLVGAENSALEEFSYAGDYDELQRYLLFFLVDYCPSTQKFSIRNDACSLFDKFIKGKHFIQWFESITDSEQIAINNVIENLQDGLKTPHLLLEQLEEI